MSPMTDKGNRWQTRIVGRGDVPTAEIVPNRHNWRRHPDRQRDALEGVLDSIGWIQDVIVNKRTGNLIDGHLRVEMALRRGEKTVPVVYVDLSEDEEAVALASLDPISAMAETDRTKLEELMRDVNSGDARVQQMMSDLAEKEELVRGTSDDLPEPGEQREPELPAEVFIEIYCSKSDLEDFRETLNEWKGRDGVTVNISG